jgi:syntaxin 5
VTGNELSLQQYQQPVDDFSQRTDAIRDIETTLTEISGMYVKLGELVSIQGELTSKIESNIEEASSHVEEGSNQIMEWYGKVTSSRGLMLKLFLVLVAFIIFVAIFML